MTKTEIQQVKQRFGIIGNTEALLRAIDVAIQVAPTDLSVLITGESGVGKESFPQIIHQYSRRKHGQYIAVNCGAIPEGTIDSELFGHEKGAFTGAIGERKGYFGEADGGTIFLDEVGELPLPTQARLLRVLESGEFIKVGSSKVQKTDVRIVAATNVNLTQAIAEGRFREDLYYRLNTVPIQIPPLRERGDDVLLLFRKFAADFAAKYRMPAIQLTEDAKKELLAYPWPGNVRQLKNITEQISIIETNREITAAILQTYLPAQNVQRLPALLGTRESKSFESEREILYSVLFDMRQEVAELRKMVHNMMAERAGQVAQMGQVGQVVATPVVTTANQPSVPAIIHPMQQATVYQGYIVPAEAVRAVPAEIAGGSQDFISPVLREIKVKIQVEVSVFVAASSVNTGTDLLRFPQEALNAKGITHVPCGAEIQMFPFQLQAILRCQFFRFGIHGLSVGIVFKEALRQGAALHHGFHILRVFFLEGIIIRTCLVSVCAFQSCKGQHIFADLMGVFHIDAIHQAVVPGRRCFPDLHILHTQHIHNAAAHQKQCQCDDGCHQQRAAEKLPGDGCFHGGKFRLVDVLAVDMAQPLKQFLSIHTVIPSLSRWLCSLSLVRLSCIFTLLSVIP